MPTVSTRTLKDQLSSYLQRAEAGEQIVVQIERSLKIPREGMDYRPSREELDARDRL